MTAETSEVGFRTDVSLSRVQISVPIGNTIQNIIGYMKTGGVSFLEIYTWQRGLNGLTLRVRNSKFDPDRIMVPANMGPKSLIWYDEGIKNDKPA